MNGKQLLDLVEILVVLFTKIPILPILIFFSLIGIFIGIFLIKKPALAIEIQRRFYAKINWKIEPISMRKEISNTKIMGYILIIILIVVFIFSLAYKSIFQ